MGKEKEGMFFDHDNNINNIVNDANNKLDSILVNIQGIIKQRDDALNHIYELEKTIDNLIDEKKELLNKVFSLQDQINNRDRFGNFRDI